MTDMAAVGAVGAAVAAAKGMRGVCDGEAFSNPDTWRWIISEYKNARIRYHEHGETRSNCVDVMGRVCQ